MWIVDSSRRVNADDRRPQFPSRVSRKWSLTQIAELLD
jgi:hypothetical protein